MTGIRKAYLLPGSRSRWEAGRDAAWKSRMKGVRRRLDSCGGSPYPGCSWWEAAAEGPPSLSLRLPPPASPPSHSHTPSSMPPLPIISASPLSPFPSKARSCQSLSMNAEVAVLMKRKWRDSSSNRNIPWLLHLGLASLHIHRVPPIPFRAQLLLPCRFTLRRAANRWGPSLRVGGAGAVAGPGPRRGWGGGGGAGAGAAGRRRRGRRCPSRRRRRCSPAPSGYPAQYSSLDWSPKWSPAAPG